MNTINQRKFEVFATGTLYDTELEEHLEKLGFTQITVTSTLPQNKLRSLFPSENLSGLCGDCRNVILSFSDYQPYYEELVNACNTDNTLELFDNLAMVLNRHLVEYRANRLLQELMEDTLSAHDERCKRVCKRKKSIIGDNNKATGATF